MLNLFQSNQMSALARAFCLRLTPDKGAHPDPFQPETVIVQSFGIGQWLKLEVAAQHGIAANMDCVLPATFLWRLYQALIPESSALRESPYVRERLAWRIMRLLEAHPDLARTVSNYLAGTGARDLRGFQLSWELAQLFDEYLMYRPDWMLSGSLGDSYSGDALQDHRDWQTRLWQLLQEDLGPYRHLHRAALHQRTLQLLDSQDLDNTNNVLTSLPRISVFGLSTLPPLQLQTFEALARHVDVDVYFLNPCSQYWGDIVSEKDQARRSLRRLLSKDDALTDEDYLETGNPLLSSLGRQGREFLELMLDSPHVVSEEAFVELPETSALNIVKNDLLELTFGGEFGTGCRPVPRPGADPSLQLHVCHSRMREVEVLHDELLRIIAQQPDIALNDIIVMAPDMNRYAPYVESVFRHSLTSRVADTSSLEDSVMVSSFLQLLALPDSRLTAPEVLDLLEVPAIMRRFELDYTELDRMAEWVDQSGIRWEISGDTRARYWDLPAERQNTWQFGLDRLLLGLAMDETSPWEGVLPYAVTPAETTLLGKLISFVKLLEHYRDLLREPRSPADWQVLIAEMTQQFFDARDQEVLDLNQILNQAMVLADGAGTSDYDNPISYQLVDHVLRQGLSLADGRAAFMSGGITFATLVPMRSIPFRVVCLLGMNDGEYPRETRPHSFDLMAAQNPRRGDRLKNQDDRYLFLESLMSAQDVFYVSYIGRGARDNQDKPPSVVVSEWISYLGAVFSDLSVHQHALQPFNPRYYRGDSRQSYATGWYQALTEPDIEPFSATPLPADPNLACTSVHQLAQFIRHTGRYFLQQRLGVSLAEDATQLRDVETFQLDGLERHQVADAALNALVRQEDLVDLGRRLKLAGTLPAGIIGDRQLAREFERASTLFDALVPYLGEATRLRESIAAGDRILEVDVNNLHGAQLLNYQVGELRARQLLECWVRHLAVNAAGHSLPSVIVHKHRSRPATVTHIEPLDRGAAEAELVRLLDLYDQGTCEPLFLPPEASKMFHEYRDNPDDATRRMMQNWHSDQPGAEGQDRTWQRLLAPDSFGELFQQRATDLWQPLQARVKHD